MAMEIELIRQPTSQMVSGGSMMLFAQRWPCSEAMENETQSTNRIALLVEGVDLGDVVRARRRQDLVHKNIINISVRVRREVEEGVVDGEDTWRGRAGQQHKVGLVLDMGEIDGVSSRQTR
jgi:hypothetical protein